jgi:metallo-beta-lactamase class B
MKNFFFLITAIFLFCLITLAYAQDNYKKIKVTKDIEVFKLSEHSYFHISYSQMPQFGRVASNGFVFVNNGKAFLFDTPTNDSLTKDLVGWIQDSLKVQIVGFVPNHWHVDCMGGLNYLHSIGIESYANELTREIAQSKNLPVPKHGFTDSLSLDIEGKKILCRFYGAAHSLDNIVVWIPSEKILFGGCMVKELNSTGMGNTVDGDLKEWPKTIKKVLRDYPDAKIVIPGHGQFGGTELLKHTLDLLLENK